MYEHFTFPSLQFTVKGVISHMVQYFHFVPYILLYGIISQGELKFYLECLKFLNSMK